MVQLISGKTEKDLEEHILESMKEHLYLDNSFEDCGKTIEDLIIEFDEYSIEDVVEILFPDETENDQLKEVLKSILFLGDGSTNPCDQCGCEMEVQDESQGKYSWQNHNCENPYCDNGSTNEPDWDSMPGGHDYNI